MTGSGQPADVRRARPPGAVSALRCYRGRVSWTSRCPRGPGRLPQRSVEEGGDDSGNTVSSMCFLARFLEEATMKKILLAASFLALMACTASAEGLNLGWSDCPAGTPAYHLDENFACNTNTGTPHI